MHIAFIISTMTSGGAERVVANLANKFVNHGYKITIIKFDDELSYYKLDKKIEVKSYKFKSKNKIDTFIKSINYTRKAFNEVNPDIIISFLSTVNITSIISNLIKKRTIIISERNDPYNSPKQWYYRILRRLVYRYADGYVFQTKDARNYFSKYIRKKSKIIHNPVYIKKGDYIKNKYSEKEIITVGRLEEQKNHKLLIDAFEIIHKNFDEYKLTIYGEGKLRKELEEYICEKEMQKFISLPGRENNIYQKIKNSSMFILSSNYEGMSNALMEAMALGVPCISTNCPIGGSAELIHSGINGILVKTQDLKELVSAIELLLNNNELANSIGEEAEKICNTHGIEIIYKKWEDYILEVIQRKNVVKK